ncbi:MmpS family transport accessory protein [Mycobacterium sp. NPDC003449]
MTRHYSPYDTAHTERFGDHRSEPGAYRTYPSHPGHDASYEAGYQVEDYDDFVDDIEFYEDPIDRRWIWVAGVAGAVLLVAVICTVVILGGGDSGSVSATVAPPPTETSQPATTPPQDATSTPKPVAPSAPLSPETVTTVTPSPSAPAATTPPVPAAPPAPAAAAAPATDPRTITYRVTGTRQLIDLVTIVYTDAQGALQTDINVALPWAKTVVLNPGVELKSVTATSIAGQLNCSITDASGAVILQQNTNSMISTCTQ